MSGTGGNVAGTGGAAGVGGGGACVPGATAPCYTGPAATEDVGACHGGVLTCNAAGTSFGPCVGEALPGVESCLTPEDDDCDGDVNESGAGCVCVPNTTQACYSGPVGSLNVGNCKPGVMTCNAQGTAYGPCVGEVLPAIENCATPEDEACNGGGDACGGAGWSKVFGGVLEEEGWDITTDPAGNVVVIGHFDGTVDFGGGPLTSNGNSDVFIVKYASNGAHIWSKQFGGVGKQYGYGIATDGAGNIYAIGSFNSSIDFGGGAHSSVGEEDVYVAKLSPAGAFLWSKQFGSSSSYDQGYAIDVDGAGNVGITGKFELGIDFGGGLLACAGPGDIFVAKLSTNGAYLWATSVGDALPQEGRDVAFDPAGNLYVTGGFQGTVDFGGGALTSGGADDIFLAKYSPQGAHLWSKGFGNASAQYGQGLATDAQGNVIVTGNMHGAVDFGGGVLTTAGAYDVYVARFDGGGNHLWSQRYGSPLDQIGYEAAVDSAGNVALVGAFQGVLDTGSGAMTSAGGYDIFAAKVTSAGAPVWSYRYGDALEQYARAVAVDALGNVYVTGRVQGTVDFGNGPFTSAGGFDVFVAKLAP